MIAMLLQSRLARMIGGAFLTILAILSFGAVKRREGVTAERARRDLADAKETIKAHEVRDEVEADVAAGPDPRDRLRADWRRD
jgi:hypothetical protein